MTGENALKACDLLPCPFCGSKKSVHSAIRDGRSVGCGDCGATCHAYNPDSLRKAVAAWNTRSPVCEDARELVEALEKAVEHFESAPDERFFPAHLYEWTSEAASLLDTVREALAKSLPSPTEMTAEETKAEILRLNRRAIELAPLAGWYLKIRIEDAPPLPGGGL